MLHSHRRLEVEELGARVVESTVLHPEFRLALQVREGLVEDIALFQHSFPARSLGGRAQIFVPLWGETRIRRPESEFMLRTGEVATDLRERACILRRERSAATLILEWEPGLLSTRVVEPSSKARIGKEGLRRIQAAVLPMLDAGLTPASAARIVAEVVDLLRAEGFPFDRVHPDDLHGETPSSMAELLHAVDGCVSLLKGKPMVVDLERTLGCSRRQIQRRIIEFHKHFAFNATGGWRDLLSRWRLYAGAVLMSTPDATTEFVAQKLGYASATGFCHAFANAGLPSPGAIRRRLRELA